MPIHGNFALYKESEAQDPFTLQNKKMLKVFMHYGPVKAKIGSMVAYQGDVRFEHAGSGGASKWLKSKVTGEGLAMMNVTGQGEVFLADAAQEIQILYLENDQLSVNGAGVLAYSTSLQDDIQRVAGGTGAMMAGGLYNVTLTGSGYVAVLTDGEPIVFDVGAGAVFADAQAAVCWTSGVRMDIKTDINLKSLIGKGSGESIQMAFSGQGYVMVQPSEGVPQGAAQPAGGGGLLGNLGG